MGQKLQINFSEHNSNNGHCLQAAAFGASQLHNLPLARRAQSVYQFCVVIFISHWMTY